MEDFGHGISTICCHKYDYEDYQSKNAPKESVPKHPTVPFIPYSLAPDSDALKEQPDITSKKENKDSSDNGNKTVISAPSSVQSPRKPIFSPKVILLQGDQQERQENQIGWMYKLLIIIHTLFTSLYILLFYKCSHVFNILRNVIYHT